ncbi:hypothetical protein L1887_35280 [Cichorium endivia]|nr:hypothetical protein L1887_35280 [Cichorium endivia]
MSSPRLPALDLRRDLRRELSSNGSQPPSPVTSIALIIAFDHHHPLNFYRLLCVFSMVSLVDIPYASDDIHHR